MGITSTVRRKLVEIVGLEDFIEETRMLEEYTKDPGNPVMINPKRPVAIIKPESLDEVKRVVKLLNDEKIPIVPRSCGLDYHGNAIPVVEGAVILDLSKMGRIVEVHPTAEEGMCAVVEPGVTFEELQKELDRYDVRIQMPARHPAKATIVSTYANKHPSFRSSWQGLFNFPMYMPTVELVTADGEEFRSGGSHAGTGTFTAMGMGLDRIPLGSLGTSGIITKGVVILERKPKIRKIFFARFDEFEGVAEATTRVLRFSSKEIGETHVVMNNFCLASLLSDSYERFDSMGKTLPPWTYIICISGPDDKWVEIQEKHLTEIAEELRIEFVSELSEAREAGNELLDEFTMPYRVGRVYEYAPHNRVEFYTTFSRIPRYDRIIRDVLSKRKYNRPLGIFILPIEQARTCYIEYDLYFDPSKEEEVMMIRDMLNEIYPKLIDTGAFFVRSDYPVINEKLRERGADYYELMDEVKKIFDPNNIFNPGRVFK